MANSLLNKIINELRDNLKRKFNDFIGIYLYGSYARGEQDENSDFDLALVFEEKKNWQQEREIQDLIADIDIKYVVIIDGWIFSKSDLYKQNTPLRENILKEGIYYEA